MENEPVEMNKMTDEAKKELRDFDEQEAYFLLCEIFAHAQATQDYAKFQRDLNEWKKRYNIELFSEELKVKIKYMLSKEFLDKVLKDFIAFDELSKKDPAKGIEKLRKVLNKVEKDKNKNEKMLDKELENLYKEYPLSFLKEKYPHIVGQLLSKSNKTRILEKFDSSLASRELDNIVEHPNEYEDKDEFISTIEEWKRLYPINDFNDKYKVQVEATLKDALDKNKLEERFPISTELDLSEGQEIPIEIKADMNVISKEAMYDFIEIRDRNINDMNSLFNWIYKYKKYINELDVDVKNVFVESLEKVYGAPKTQSNYYIPKMNNDELLTLSDYKSMEDTKRMVVMQLFGKLYFKEEFTHEDSYNLGIIYSNAEKAKEVEEANVDKQVEEFMKEVPENELTPYDTVSIQDNTKANIDYKNTTIQIEETIEGDSIKVVEDEENAENKENTIEDDIENRPSFKETLKVDGVELERVESSNNSSANDTSGAVSSGGGGGVSITRDIPETVKEKEEEIEEESNKGELGTNKTEQAINNIQLEQNLKNNSEESNINAVIIEAKPKIVEENNTEKIEAIELNTEIIRDDEPNGIQEEPFEEDGTTEVKTETVEIEEPIEIGETRKDDLNETKEFKTIDDVENDNEEPKQFLENELDDDSEPPIEENTRKSIVQRLISFFQKDNEAEEIELNNEENDNEIESIEPNNNEENDREERE